MQRIRDLKAQGLTDTELARFRRDHERLTRGTYVERGLEAWDLYRRKCEAVLAGLRPGAALAGPTAAAMWGVPFSGPPPKTVFVSNVTRGRYGNGIKVLAGSDVVQHEGLLVTRPTVTVAQSATLLRSRDALIVADSMLAGELCTAGELREAAESMHRAKGVRRFRWVVANADGRSESPGETWTRMTVTQLGYEVTPQFHVQHANREAFLDLLVDGTMTGIEFDGIEKYRTKQEAQVVYEHLREGDLQELGYLLVRLVWLQVPNHAQLDKRLRATGAVPVHKPRMITW